MKRRIFITGCSGYLAQRLIDVCRHDPEVEWLGGIDIRPPNNCDGLHFFTVDIRSPEIAALLRHHRVDTVVHLAWVFNPTHEPHLEYEVDVLGSQNILESAKKTGVSYLLYLSSTTAYGPHADNPPIFDENYPRRGHEGYLYSKYKAEVDHLMLDFMTKNPDMRMFIIRAPIILGPNTRNVVTAITELPVMFGIKDNDPSMQFLHEEDLQRLLAWAVRNQPQGLYNVPGLGTIRYSELAKCLKKKCIWLPAWLLYPAVGFLWKLHLLPFPPSILDFVRYPWVAAGDKFKAACNFQIEHSSRDAFLAFAKARWPEKF